MKVISESEVAQSCPTLSYGLQPSRLLRPWDFLGKSTGVGCHCLLRDNGKDKYKILVRLGAREGLNIKCPGENIYDLKNYPSSSVFSKVDPKPQFQTLLR